MTRIAPYLFLIYKYQFNSGYEKYDFSNVTFCDLVIFKHSCSVLESITYISNGNLILEIGISMKIPQTCAITCTRFEINSFTLRFQHMYVKQFSLWILIFTHKPYYIFLKTDTIPTYHGISIAIPRYIAMQLPSSLYTWLEHSLSYCFAWL